MGDDEKKGVDPAAAAAANEARNNWFMERVCTSLQCKSDKFKKLMLAETDGAAMQEFFNDAERQRVFVCDGGKELTSFATPDLKQKKKMVYFIKLQKEAVTADNCARVVMSGDLLPGKEVLQHLYDTSSDVYLPLLSNSHNQGGLPEVVIKDVMEYLHKLVGTIYVTIGHSKGETLLPLPPMELPSVDRASKDKERVHVLETAVVTWTKQIKNVLKLDPEQMLKGGTHPGPMAELEFWAAKARHLNSIQQQLGGERIRKVMKVLDLTKSTYCSPFNRLMKEVAAACEEANDNTKYLATLKTALQKLSEIVIDAEAFQNLTHLFRPIVHLIMLVWKHSRFYNSPARLVVLMREICNDLIAQARSFLNPQELFQMEPQEAVDKLMVTLKVCGQFKSVYFDYKSRANNEVPSNPWRLQNTSLFPRLDSFLERCHDLLDLFKTFVQFMKLERIEIGGNKGRTLSASVVQIFADFKAVAEKFIQVPYDVLDVEVKKFDDDFYVFRCSIKELERRLGSVLNQGFDDCATVFAAFKLIESFEGLLEREFIQADLERKHLDLLKAYSSDLRDVQDIYTRQKDQSAVGFYLEREGPPLYCNMPPVAGAIYWVKGLKLRIEEPMFKLKATLKTMLESEEAKDVMKTYGNLIEALDKYAHEVHSSWEKGVEDVSQANLKNPILRRDEKGLLAVNFDPELIRLLREVKYLLELGKGAPASALELNKKAETYRVQRGCLQVISDKYNHIMHTMLEVEQPLLAAQLKMIDKALEKGQKHLTWKSHAIDDFVRETTTLVKDTYDTLLALKTNMKDIQNVLAGWFKEPLLKRKSTKTYSPDDYQEEFKGHLAARYNDIGNEGKEIHKMLLKSNQVLKVSKGAPTWRAYVDFINDIVIDGLARTVCGSLECLNTQLDPAQITKEEIAPFIEIQLELDGSSIEFKPALHNASGGSDKPSMHAMIDYWCMGFFNVCKLVKRLDRADGDFLKEVMETEQVRFFVHQIQSHVRANQALCEEFKDSFQAYKAVWTSSIDDHLHEFLAPPEEDPTKPKAEEEEVVEKIEGPLAPKYEPPLDAFDKEIHKFVKYASNIQAISSSAARGWLKIDARPVKQALATWINKWQFRYTSYLQSSIEQTLTELKDFMVAIKKGLSQEVEPDDAEALLRAMTCIRDVRLRADLVTGMFEPLRAKVQLLKKYGVIISQDFIEMMDDAPHGWNVTTRITYNSREQLAPLQSLQAEKIKEQAEEFGHKVVEFRADFKEEAPFNYSVGEDCYKKVDEWNTKIDQIENAAKSLQERQGLFDVNKENWKEIKVCRDELKLLKKVWDHVELVNSIFNSWKATLWPDVNVDSMMIMCSKIQKEIKALDRPVRGWDCYLGMMKEMADMLIDLPLVQDLRDDAMRERHWKKLMRICGKTFVMDDKMSLGVLLSLELHKFADPVGEVVEQARMEIKIDKALQRIETIWNALQFEYEPFKSSGVKVLKMPDTTIESLDDHEVQLQNMMGNRFKAFFEIQITTWKGKLSQCRAVLENWLEVQRQWCSLEAIFIGSEDIREQLPEDAKRFDGIDASFKEQMADACNSTNPLDATLKDGRDEAFKVALAALELCNRSLSDYLETKRRKFPRFYFISQVDLVDTLSKGKFPPAVQEHFSKFTDCIGGIMWERDPETKLETGVCKGMFATDKEEVHFAKELDCRGPVEDWLKEIMVHCNMQFKDQLEMSINEYTEMSRETWCEKYCAQIAITTCQTWWSTEVYQAFDRLEQGNDQGMKEYSVAQIANLNVYVQMVLGEMTGEMRTKVKTLITIEVHARDVVLKYIAERIDSAGDFAWQSQLKFRWDEEKSHCMINISDAEFQYSYEYVGNPGRLVITGLTDRCYITLTQALRLCLGGAPAGPAGTGKTETTKDLGRGLAIWVIVMNCSDQMNYKTMANIFMGLSQTGAWGCFDEFNRIPVEVLSVVAGQYGALLDGIKAVADEIIFEEEKIALKRTVGAFITMNPGYAGRTELPENLKALFRGVAMCTPDFAAIIEIELSAEGFETAKVLSIKFIRLFQLNMELLSKQDHYDWGLRAIKGILRIAGGAKRANPERTELEIMMRALRDSNVTKFVNADVGIFLGLVNDIFPKMQDATKQADPIMTKAVRDVLKENKVFIKNGYQEGLQLQPEDIFVGKTVDLAELLGIRHCVFALGCAGSGKTCVWKTLQAAQTHLAINPATRTPAVGDGPTLVNALNPKAVTSDDLYGFVHPVTKEPFDGIIAKIMRDFKNASGAQLNVPKWVMLDGDIDAEWIESMNTVMDDNKVLTLVSNERIPLSRSMRLIFEISNLKNGSPATVSRAGVLFLNETDVGWGAYFQSWVDNLCAKNAHIDTKEQAWLEALVQQYVPPTLDNMRKNKWMHLTPLMNFGMVSTLCSILEGVLTAKNVPQGTDKDVYEAYFQFAAIWAFGGAFGADKANDFRKLFSEWWRMEWGKMNFKFPDEGLVFDYFIDDVDKKGKHWRDVIPKYTHVLGEGASFSSIVVPTLDTTRLTFLIDDLATRAKPVMLVGGAGTAKTTIIQDKLGRLPEEIIYFNINLNSFTIASILQAILEQPLEKKTGTMFAPPGTKKLIYFVDDMNMPTPDKYSTQSAIALLNQQLEYGGFYDLKKLTMKEIRGVQYLSSMNPTAGSFFIQDRMQRHFATFATLAPEAEVLRTIYGSILDGHLSNGYSQEMRKVGDRVCSAALMLHKLVADAFMPTAVAFHYAWNLREMSRVFQGILKCTPDYYTEPMYLARLWLHESYRVYSDRLVDVADATRFEDMINRAAKSFFEDFDQDALMKRPIVFTYFAVQTDEDIKPYFQVPDEVKLSKILTQKLTEYNETFARMDLVLFVQAMEHVSRISRIIDTPRGNALLVGVGGSGKQSLTRLAAFISGFTVFQIKLTSAYGMIDFKADIAALYASTGLKGNSIVWLFTDQQIINERMLIYFNDLLSSGFIPDLYTQDDKDNVLNGIRPEVKAAGLMDSPDICWNFFLDRVRKNLHVVLCMSPVGNAFRNRCRKFPALISATVIDWFHPWPSEALISVAMRFLQDVDISTDELKENVAHHMSFVHQSVEECCTTYLAAERRNVYTTPKSYLELIQLYQTLYKAQCDRVDALKIRLESGLVKLRGASTQVAEMQIVLKDESVIVEQKKADTDVLLVQVGQESTVADEQAALGAIEAEKVAVIQQEVSAFAAQCNADLLAAEPAIAAAAEALNSLDKASLTELKSMSTPSPVVLQVCNAVQYMMAPKGQVKKVKTAWGEAKKMMASVDEFLKSLINFDKDNLLLENKAEVRAKCTGTPEAPNPEFNYTNVKRISMAAAGLCDWVINILIYHDIYLDVAPKRMLLQEAMNKLGEANKKLAAVNEHVDALNARKAALQNQLMQATEEKNALIAKAAATAKKLSLAERLVNGLKDEGVRWAANVELLGEEKAMLVGNMMVAAPFIAYIGPFNSEFRYKLWEQTWVPDLRGRQLPSAEVLDPLKLLSDVATQAIWMSEGLPSDRLSLENAAIIVRCARYPLIIDPQLQGISWIRGRETPNGLVSCQQSFGGYLDMMAKAMEEGIPMLLEKCGQAFDAVMENVLARATIAKGRKLILKLGDKEVDMRCNPDPETGMPLGGPLFRLYLQSKLPNPHYIPEVQAQCTIINFTVTERGLEEQLLAKVVKCERPDLEEQRAALVAQQNDFTIRLKALEDGLLEMLANAEGDITENEALIESLEAAKETSQEITAKVAIAKETEVIIAKAREIYRPLGERGALMFFLVNQLFVISHMYQFSLDTFNYMFLKAISKTKKSNDIDDRFKNLMATISFVIFAYVTRGLFERDRILFSSQLGTRIMNRRGELPVDEQDFLIKAPRVMDGAERSEALQWLPEQCWATVQALAENLPEVFSSLPADLEGSNKRWKEFFDNEQPENEKLPGEFNRVSGFQRLLVMRALRPDRMVLAMKYWVRDEMGVEYYNAIPFDLPSSFEDTSPATPVFFLLSPGVDPLLAVRQIGGPADKTEANGLFFSVSLGQGQEPVAEKALDRMQVSGGWVMLQNVELVARWLPKLEKKLEALIEGANPGFRVFLSSLPQNVIPVQILQNSIKLTNEPPSGLRPNMIRAFNTFNDTVWEACPKQSELKAIIFALGFFHSIVCERRQFGAIGWQRPYPFAPGDLSACIIVATNFLNDAPKVPWADLQYIFGEVMYGGHITDDLDRRLCASYLSVYMTDALLDGYQLYPKFEVPPPTGSHKQFVEYIDENLINEGPMCYGLHPNAEINFMTAQSLALFKNCGELAPRGGGGAGGMTLQEKVKRILDDIMERMPELFPLAELDERTPPDERTPYTSVFLQECERMNRLLFEVKRSLVELDLGLKGDLGMTETMEALMNSLYDNKVPASWAKVAYPSMRGLASWLLDMLQRQRQLEAWTADLATPKVTWIAGLFNPQAFLTAVMQVLARKNELPLDRMTTVCDVTKKMNPDEIEGATRDGAYVNGFFLEGARWDVTTGMMDDSILKQLYCPMPVVLMKAALADKGQRDVYECPSYKTLTRNPVDGKPTGGYIFTAGLKTKQSVNKWILAGVALIMDVETT
jgi:dynein heavy chain